MKKVMKKVLALLCVTAMSGVLLTGCGEKAAEPAAPADKEQAAAPAESSAPASDEQAASDTGAKKRIGISLVYKGDEWCAAVDQEFNKQASEFGYEVNIQDGNLDNETQVKQIENFITQQYDMIAVDPASPEGIIPALEKASAANIPIVVFDSATAYEDIVSYVSWDSYETGTLIGKYLHDVIQKDYSGKANVAVLTMSTPVNIADRIRGVKDALKDLDITYVAEQDYEGNREKAANIITNIKENIDFVVAGQDNGAWGAVSALQALNNKTTKCYSMGAYGAEPFQALVDNNSNYGGTVAVSPSKLVAATYGVMQDYFAGKTDIPDVVNIDLDLVVPDNINQYIADNDITLE
ncbi:sugar ABC transporter substrate-binding protein [Diplocloster agilis]|uniref:Sugar ABC transporter substrate-binding protein n=1 Tax=Diplocloster agilis TaxID=2850323 RepID=A0A949NJ69_9FIRM|nr:MULTISPECIES: sugar ABC transporter substrate-binding protein [Lachnospiraceae]MBU9739635.1 sugar ABC transporter substrate-binding protein [Diplocloster agilis]MBU9746889.1 sugar ABC transporter substrate-binding protein [Diplocloster agilis]MCU6736830.1 sugar ABC transporter substrate-binding protein [Suonthocola fibrivorans]SCJ93892.1 ABC transporter periplasmic-binding protein ytfQ precursor [uncultured Clostridium sp.]